MYIIANTCSIRCCIFIPKDLDTFNLTRGRFLKPGGSDASRVRGLSTLRRRTGSVEITQRHELKTICSIVCCHDTFHEQL